MLNMNIPPQLSVAIMAAGMIAVVASPLCAQAVERHYYGAKFEPREGVLHGAGQTYYREPADGPLSQGFNNYAQVVGPQRFPLLYMDYTNWRATTESFYASLGQRLDAIEAKDDRRVVPQLGMVLPAGEQRLTEQHLDNLAAGLRSLDRPVFFRPGYEANGPWNRLSAATFIANYRMIADRVREENLPVAMVWNVVVGDGGPWSTWAKAKRFYPGDTYVDWWSFNLFGTATFDEPVWRAEVDKFLAAAHAAEKPVMIGEATPQFVGAEDASDWETWFAKFFARIDDSPGIKAHSYINRDWGATHPHDGWTPWQDSRLETAAPRVRANYLKEISNSLYIHAGPTLREFFGE